MDNISNKKSKYLVAYIRPRFGDSQVGTVDVWYDHLINSNDIKEFEKDFKCIVISFSKYEVEENYENNQN